MVEGPNARDQIAFCPFHSLLVEVQRMLATYMRRMRNNNLIRIGGATYTLWDTSLENVQDLESCIRGRALWGQSLSFVPVVS